MPKKTSASQSPAIIALDQLLANVRESDVNGNKCTYDPWPLASIDENLTEGNLSEWSRLRAERQSATENWKGAFVRSPHLQFIAASSCTDLKRSIENGDGGAVLDAVAKCAAHGLVMPGWLAEAFLARYGAITNGDARDWNSPNAFGPALSKGVSVAGVRATVQLAPWAYKEACRMLVEDPNRPLDALFYHEVGEVVGVGQTHVQNLVKEHVARNEHCPPLKHMKTRLCEGDSYEKTVVEWNNKKHKERMEKLGIFVDETL